MPRTSDMAGVFSPKFKSSKLYSARLCLQLVTVLSASLQVAASSCQDSGCLRLFSGRGVCVDLRNITATSLETDFDLTEGGFTGSCSCSHSDCLCRCFKTRDRETKERKLCSQTKTCTKKGGQCFTRGSGPDGAKDLGWCNKKKKCKCYSRDSSTPTPAPSCSGKYRTAVSPLHPQRERPPPAPAAPSASVTVLTAPPASPRRQRRLRERRQPPVQGQLRLLLLLVGYTDKVTAL